MSAPGIAPGAFLVRRACEGMTGDARPCEEMTENVREWQKVPCGARVFA